MTEQTASTMGNGDMPITQVWFSFEGRIGRQTYWLKYFLPWLGIYLAAGILDGIVGTGIVFILVAQIIGLWPGLAVSVKRCHDRSRSGWFLLISLIPLVGAIWLLIELGFLKGSEGENRFGPDPLA